MKKCVLGDYILDMASGPFGSNLKVECFVPSGFPIIDGANLYGVRVTDNVTKFVTEAKAHSLSRSIAKRHDVIVTISGTLGQVAYIPSDSLYEEYLCSQRQFRVTFDESKIDVEYLVNLLHTDYGQKKILSFANYVGVPALSQPLPNFRRIELELPDIEKQHKVAKIISTIDRKIALNRKRIATLEAMAKEIYDYWFVQFDFPDAHGRPYKSSGGAMVYNPDLKREIPKGWEVRPLGDIAEVVNGATPSTANPRNYDGDVVWITPKDLSDQRSKFTYGGSRTISRQGYDSCSTHMLPRGSILMSSRAPIGLLSIAAVDLCTNQGFKSFVPKEIDDNLYLYYYLKEHMAQIEAMGSGTTFKEVSRESMISFPIPYVSDREVYASFVVSAKLIFNQQELLGKELARLSVLRDFLLPVLIQFFLPLGAPLYPVAIISSFLTITAPHFLLKQVALLLTSSAISK